MTQTAAKAKTTVGKYEIKTDSGEVTVACRECNRRTKHGILVELNVQDYNEEYEVHTYEEHQIIECRGCESLSFREDWGNSEDIEHDADGHLMMSRHETVYPRKEADRAALNHSEFLPKVVREVYDETRRAMAAKFNILAGIGIRAILDAVCRHQKTTPGNLSNRLKELTTKGVLTAREEKALHGTRVLGNNAAHEAAIHDEDMLEAAFDMVEHLLKNLYVIPQIGKLLPKEKRRKKKKAKTKPPAPKALPPKKGP